MPLVNIYILSGKSPEYIKAVGDGINSAVIETMGFPLDDRYQIIHQFDSDHLQLQGLDGDRVMMYLVMRAGRSNELKQAFYKKVVENLKANPGIPPENVLITITENHDIDWSFRDGIAQFMVYPDTDITKHKQATKTAMLPFAVPTKATTSGTIVVKTNSQPENILLMDYLIGVVVLALVGLVFWRSRRTLFVMKTEIGRSDGQIVPRSNVQCVFMKRFLRSGIQALRNRVQSLMMTLVKIVTALGGKE